MPQSTTVTSEIVSKQPKTSPVVESVWASRQKLADYHNNELTPYQDAKKAAEAGHLPFEDKPPIMSAEALRGDELANAEFQSSRQIQELADAKKTGDIAQEITKIGQVEDPEIRYEMSRGALDAITQRLYDGQFQDINSILTGCPDILLDKGAVGSIKNVVDFSPSDANYKKRQLLGDRQVTQLCDRLGSETCALSEADKAIYRLDAGISRGKNLAKQVVSAESRNIPVSQLINMMDLPENAIVDGRWVEETKAADRLIEVIDINTIPKLSAEVSQRAATESARVQLQGITLGFAEAALGMRSYGESAWATLSPTQEANNNRLSLSAANGLLKLMPADAGPINYIYDRERQYANDPLHAEVATLYNKLRNKAALDHIDRQQGVYQGKVDRDKQTQELVAQRQHEEDLRVKREETETQRKTRQSIIDQTRNTPDIRNALGFVTNMALGQESASVDFCLKQLDTLRQRRPELGSALDQAARILEQFRQLTGPDSQLLSSHSEEVIDSKGVFGIGKKSHLETTLAFNPTTLKTKQTEAADLKNTADLDAAALTDALKLVEARTEITFDTVVVGL